MKKSLNQAKNPSVDRVPFKMDFSLKISKLISFKPVVKKSVLEGTLLTDGFFDLIKICLHHSN